VKIVKVVNTPYIVVTKISPDFLRNHQRIKKNVYELSGNKVLTVNREPDNMSSYHV